MGRAGKPDATQPQVAAKKTHIRSCRLFIRLASA